MGNGLIGQYFGESMMLVKSWAASGSRYDRGEA